MNTKGIKLYSGYTCWNIIFIIINYISWLSNSSTALLTLPKQYSSKTTKSWLMMNFLSFMDGLSRLKSEITKLINQECSVSRRRLNGRPGLVVLERASNSVMLNILQLLRNCSLNTSFKKVSRTCHDLKSS